MAEEKIFNMRVLVAGHGDCLWIEYGNPDTPNRVLVDGGTTGTFARLRPMLDKVRSEDAPSHALLVVTHVDADHIEGVLPILDSPLYAGQFDEIWFNGRNHLNPVRSLEQLGAVQADRLTTSIKDRTIAWNRSFDKGTLVVPAKGPLPLVTLPGGAKVTLLSPGWPKLEKMAVRWDLEIAGAGLKKGFPREELVVDKFLEILGPGGPNIDDLLKEKFTPDDKPANGSSIAMLIEFEGATLLLGADAHPDIFTESIRRHTGGEKMHVDVFKLPHHGSRRNATPELLELVSAGVYVFSTNGAYHGHPDQDAVARVIESAPPGATLVFNCRTKFNKMWESPKLQATWNYKTVYGVDEDGVDVSLL